MEQLQTIKQSKEGGWAREEEKSKDGIEGSGGRSRDRDARKYLRGTECAKKDWGWR